MVAKNTTNRTLVPQRIVLIGLNIGLSIHYIFPVCIEIIVTTDPTLYNICGTGADRNPLDRDFLRVGLSSPPPPFQESCIRRCGVRVYVYVWGYVYASTHNTANGTTCDMYNAYQRFLHFS